MSSKVLDEVVAWVCCRNDGDNSIQNALISKLHSLGAKTVSRLSKDVTHIIFKRKLHPSDEEKLLEDAEVRQLYDKALKVMPPPFIVTPMWVQSSDQQGRRAMERTFVVTKPPEHILKHMSKTPPCGRKPAGSAVKSATTSRKPRRRQIPDAGLSPAASDVAGAVQHASKRARTTYNATEQQAVCDVTVQASSFAHVPGSGVAATDSENAVRTPLAEQQNVRTAIPPIPPVNIAFSKAKASTCEGDENFDANLLPLSNHFQAVEVSPAGNLVLNSPLYATVAHTEKLTSAPHTAGRLPAQSTSGALDHSSPTKPRSAISAKLKPIAASAAGTIASVLDAFGIMGPGKGRSGRSLHRGFLGSKRKTNLAVDPVATTSDGGLQQTVFVASSQVLDDAEVVQIASPREVPGSVSEVAQVHGSPVHVAPRSIHLRPSSAMSSEVVMFPKDSASDAPMDSLGSYVPGTPSEGLGRQPAQKQSGIPPSPTPSSYQTDPKLPPPPEPEAAPSTFIDVLPDADISMHSDGEDGHPNVDVIPDPAATLPALEGCGSPGDVGIPPRCPSPACAASPSHHPFGMPFSPASVSGSPSDKGRISPSGRVRQLWNIPPAVEARRASHESPAWMQRAEAAMAEAARASPAKRMTSSHSSLPPVARSPSNQHTGSSSNGSLTGEPDTAVNPELHRSTDDLDMMLGGLPPLVAKTMSPAGKLASPTNLTKVRSKPERGSKKSMDEDGPKRAATAGEPAASASASRQLNLTRSSISRATAGKVTAENTSNKPLVVAKVRPAPIRTSTAAAGPSRPTAAAKPKTAASALAAELGPSYHRSVSVPHVRPAWGAGSGPDVGRMAQTTRLLRSSINMPLKHLAGGSLGLPADSVRMGRNALSVSHVSRTSKPAANRLATSAEGLLQGNVAEAARKANRGKMLSIAEKHTAASRAKFEKPGAANTAPEVPAPAKPVVVVAAPAPAAGRTKPKYLAYTSVASEMQQLVKSAVRRLHGLRMCIDGNEDGRITHLVIGAERRTLKVLLAIANGAYLLSPVWASDSLAAQEWLPEDQYPADTRFTKVAERVREQTITGRLVKPLEGHMVFIHVPTNAHSGERAERPSERRHTLQRLVQALGGKVAPARACTLCIACEDVRRPKGMAEGVKMIRDEWLFLVAENYQQVGMAEHMIVEEQQ